MTTRTRRDLRPPLVLLLLSENQWVEGVRSEHAMTPCASDICCVASVVFGKELKQKEGAEGGKSDGSGGEKPPK